MTGPVVAALVEARLAVQAIPPGSYALDDGYRVAVGRVLRVLSRLIDAESAVERSAGVSTLGGPVRGGSDDDSGQDEAADLSAWTKVSHRIVVDAKGYVWRVYDSDCWSMVPTNPDNISTPEPVTFYVPESELDEARAEVARLRAAVEAIRQHIAISEAIGASTSNLANLKAILAAVLGDGA